MDGQEWVVLGLVGICDALDDIQEIYYVWLLVDLFETPFNLQLVLHGLHALSNHNGFQGGLVLLLELYPIDIQLQLFSD